MASESFHGQQGVDLNEAAYTCDHCGEEIVIPVDPSAGVRQEYVEDCPVCCSPNLIQVEFTGGEVRAWAEAES